MGVVGISEMPATTTRSFSSTGSSSAAADQRNTGYPRQCSPYKRNYHGRGTIALSSTFSPDPITWPLAYNSNVHSFFSILTLLNTCPLQRIRYCSRFNQSIVAHPILCVVCAAVPAGCSRVLLL